MALKDERSIGVNIAAHFDEGSLLNATRRIASMVEVLKQEMNSSDFHNYYKDVDALAKAVENAYRAFESNRNPDSALNLVKAFNALAALDKNKLGNLSDLMPDLSGAVDSAKDLAGALANAFREENFREAFAAFDSIKENGGDVIKLFERIGQSAESTEELRSTIRRLSEAYAEAVGEADELRERVRELEDDSSVGALTKKLEEAEGELSRLRLTAVEEFKTYLRSNDISPFQTDEFGDRVFSKYFDQIRDGSMTAKQAIASVKSEFASLFDDRSSGVGSEALGTISVRLDDILRKYEELSAQIREAGAAAPMERIGEAAEAGSDVIERQGETIREVASQRSAINDLNDLISMLVSVSTQAEGSTSSLYEQIIPMLEAIREFDTIDPSKLQSIGKIFDGLSGINGFKISSAQAKNLKEFLDSVSTMGDISALRSISGVNLKGFSDLSINATSLKNLATYLPTIASVNVDNLEKLQHIDLSNFASLKVPKIDTEAISGLGKLGDAMVAVKDAAVAMTGMLENAGKTAVQSGRKITDVLSQGAIGGSARMVGINKTLSREEYLRGLIGRAEAAGFDSVRSEYIGDYNAVSYLADQYNKLREAIDKGTISQKEYNEKYKELEAVTSRESGRLNAAVSEYEKNKKITQRERAAINAAMRQREAKAGWTDAEVADAGIKQQEEYIANLQRIEEETARLQDASWRGEIDDYDAEEDARLAEEIGAKREERERQLQKMQAESLQIAEQRRLEEEKQAETAEKAELRRAEAAAKADELAEQMANGRADAARRNMEQRQAEEQRMADAAKKAAEEASEAEYKRAEAAVEAERKAAEEITKLKALRIDYQDQIDRAGELGIDNDTVDGLRSQVSEIDRTIQELERVASGQGGMTAGMDAYKDSVKRARDELTLLKKQLSSDIKTTGAFVPMNENQTKAALNAIDARRREAEQQLQKAAAAGLDKAGPKFSVEGGLEDTPYNVLKDDIIPLYDELEKKVKAGAISQKEYNETLRMLASVYANVNTELNPEIQSVEELTKQYQKLGESMLKSQDDARNGVSGAWAEATGEQKSALDDLIARQSALVTGFQEGKVTGLEYRTGIGEITEEYNNLTDAVNREYQARNKAHKDTLDEMKARRSLNQEIGNATKLLRDYSAAEHSKNESSRDAYKAIQNSINGMNELGARFDRHEIDLKTLQEEESKYSNEIARNSQIIRQNGDDHMTAFGKIGRAIKTHLTTLTATASIGSIMRYIRQMVGAVREIDTAMTELRKVTDETDARYERFLDNAATRAKNLSATISDTVSATADFARLGLSIDEAEKAADAAIVYKAVGDDIASIGDAAESIISTMKAFGVEASDAMSIVDKFNKVGNEFAIGSSGVGEALKRSASAMYAANNTLEETIGLATAANTILQNPQSVGTTLKTVSMYVRAAKTELEAAGEDTEGIAESTGKLRELIMAITREGGKAVDIMADENRFKSTYQILEEISEVWDKISDTNQAALLEKLGGKRNANAIAAILENFEIAQEAMEAATNAEGSAMAELAKYQESIEGHIVGLKTAFQELSQTIIDSELVKFIINIGTFVLDAANGIAKLIKSLGGLRTILISIAAIQLMSISQHWLETISRFETGIAGLGKFFGGLRMELNLTTIAIAGIATALNIGISIYQKYKREQEETKQKIRERAEAVRGESREISELLKNYDRLSDAVKTDQTYADELKSTRDKLIDVLGLEARRVDTLTGSYEELTDAQIRNKAQSQLRADRVDLNADYNLKKDELLEAAKTSGARTIYAPGLESYSDFEADAVEYFQRLGYIKYSLENLFTGRMNAFETNFDMSSVEGVMKAYDTLSKMLDTLQMRGLEHSQLYDDIYAVYSKLTPQVDAYNVATKALNDNLFDTIYIQNILGKKLPETDEEFDTLRAAMIKTIATSGKYVGSVNEIGAALDEFLSKDESFSKFYTSMIDNSMADGNTEPLKEDVKVFDEYKKSIGDLGRALDEFNETGSVSSETYKELVAGNEEYADLFKFTGEGIELQTDKLNTYIETLGQEYGAKMAMAGATREDIQLMNALGETLVTVAEDNSNVASEIEELSGTLKEMNAGNKLTSSQMSALVKKYPKLEGAVKDLGDGYTIEADAIRELIELKAQYLSLTDRETEVLKARNALNLSNNGNTAAVAKIDEIFKKYEELNGKAISSIEEFRQGYAEVFGEAYTGGYEAYERYVEALIAQNQDLVLSESFVEDALEETNEALEDTAKSISDVQSELDNLSTVLGELNEGREYGTSEMITLLSKYPSLRNHIIKTANGYKIETSAIRELIAAKVQLISTQDSEMRIQQARTALTSITKDANADKADAVFADYLAKNGRNIESLDEYKAAYKAYYGYAAKASQAYAQAKIDAFAEVSADDVMIDLFNDYINGPLEGYDPSKEEKETSSSTEDVETEFEKAYKLHQHYLAMDRETEEQYLSWLEGAYKASYAAGEMELDDYYKYEEEVHEKRKALFSQSLDEMQHQIDLLSNQTGDTSAEQIALYEQMQKKVHAKANEYRAMGISDNDELIRELQNQWWQYEENIRQLRENAFSDWLNDKKFLIDQLKQNGASSDEIVNSWKEVLKRINDEIAYYMSKGHDITSDVIQNLMGELKEAKDSITEALDELVAKANEVVDGFQNVYTTLTNAAKEYASTGYLSVDSLQSILELGPKYMDMLYDESGQLTINEEAIQKVIAARTEEMAAETALSYAKQILLATEDNDVKKLRELADVQSESSGATWDLAYSTLGYARALGATRGIGPEFYDKAIENVTKMQSMTRTAVNTIKEASEAMKEGYVSQADGLQTILKLTEDMIKQENSDRIKQLEDEKDAYKDIIEQKKEILRLTKEQNDHDRDMADRLKEISDLQSKIDQLALDDSREARAQRAKLEEQLLEKQKSLTDSQNDYAYDAQVDALDKQYDEYEKELDKEADALKDELNSAEKLYRAAIDRISNGWDTLYQDLLNWNYNYGNTLEKELTNAWKAAQAAAERYGDFVSAMEGVNQNDKLGEASTTPTTESVQRSVNEGASTIDYYKNRMYENSLAWYTAEDKGFYEKENRRLAKEYEELTGNTLTPDSKSGYWYENGSSTPFYTLDKDEVGMAVVAAMKANSEAWKTADKSTQDKLAARNQELADRLAAFLKKPITKTAAGVWMLGDTPLYEVTKFHTGGIVGGRGSLRQNEVMALLKKGESVLDERREEALYKTVDFVQMLSDKIGHVIDKGRLSSLLAGTGASFPRGALPALAGGGIGTMNFAPTIQVTITGAGDLTESAARKYGNIAAESALAQLKSAFSQRGVSAPGNSILK